MAEEKVCFVISPIGEADSETRKRSDQVLKHVIRPAVQDCGYKAVRADEIDKPGLITSQVIQHIVNDDLVIADLTERNPNVFYELALRHAIRKPLVQIIKKGEQIPFDVAGTRTIYVDHKDLDSVDNAKNEIIEQIHALEKDPTEIETPISVSLDLQLLRQSENPEDRSLADLLAAVTDLRVSVGKIESRIGTKEQQGVLDEIHSELRSFFLKMEEYSSVERPSLIKRGHIHPMMTRDLLRFNDEKNPTISLVIISSIFRDTAPWVYELGMETYRLIRQGNVSEARRQSKDFRRALDFTIHGPMSRELFGKNKEFFVSKEFFMIADEIEPILDRILGRLESNI